MHQISTLNGSQWKGARNQDHGNVFAVGTGDTVDRAKSSDTVCDNHRADPIDSRIRIRRVGGVELIAISNPGRLTSVFQLLHQTKIVIARHTENVLDSRFLKTTK